MENLNDDGAEVSFIGNNASVINPRPSMNMRTMERFIEENKSNLQDFLYQAVVAQSMDNGFDALMALVTDRYMVNGYYIKESRVLVPLTVEMLKHDSLIEIDQEVINLVDAFGFCPCVALWDIDGFNLHKEFHQSSWETIPYTGKLKIITFSQLLF